MNNPYQTPESNLTANDGGDKPIELATRSARFLAALIDGVIGIAVAVPFWALSGAWDYVSIGKSVPFSYSLAAAAFGFLSFAMIHYYFLNKNGQTIGKKALSIRIMGIDDQLLGAVPLLLKRYLPISVVSLVPILGTILVFIDILFIFRKDRRCIHDLIAGTRVVTC